MAADLHLFTPRDAVLWKSDVRLSRAVTGNKNWIGDKAPEGTAIQYYLRSAPSGDVAVRILDLLTNEVVRDLEGTAVAGLNRVQWDLRANPEDDDEDDDEGPPVKPGVYRVVLDVNGMERSVTVRVFEDVWMR